MDEPIKLLTTQELSRLLRISGSNLLRLVRRGGIPHLRLGPKTVRYDPEAIKRWREKFFETQGEELNAITQARPQSLDISNNGGRSHVGKVHSRNRQAAGQVKGPRVGEPGKIASITAHRLAQLGSSNR